MASIAARPQQSTPPAFPALGGEGECVDATLLELVRTIGEVTDDDREIVATIIHLLKTGRVRLVGNFRGTIPDAA